MNVHLTHGQSKNASAGSSNPAEPLLARPPRQLLLPCGFARDRVYLGGVLDVQYYSGSPVRNNFTDAVRFNADGSIGYSHRAGRCGVTCDSVATWTATPTLIGTPVSSRLNR